jgi:hypothetical protein
VNNGVDPRLVQDYVKESGDDVYFTNAPSPLYDAARKTRRKHVRILEYFITIWIQRFRSSTDSNGDCLIHFLCRDKFVSLKAIRLVVEDYGQVDKLMMTDRDGFHPFLVAVMSDVSLDVIYYLVKHNPIAVLGQVLSAQPVAYDYDTVGSQPSSLFRTRFKFMRAKRKFH